MNFIKDFKEFLIKNNIDFETNENIFFLKDSKVEIYLAELETFSTKPINGLIVRKNDWILKRCIIESKLNTIFGINLKIHGRQTKIRRINANEARIFLNENHIKGYLNSKLKLGCFYNSELVAVMTFGQKRKFKHTQNYISIELIQYASKLGFTIVGGLDKLLNFAEKEFKANEIMTYLDLEWTLGNNWEKLGFQFKSFSSPLLFEVNPITYEVKKVNTIENEFTYANLGNKKIVRINQNLG